MKIFKRYKDIYKNNQILKKKISEIITNNFLFLFKQKIDNKT